MFQPWPVALPWAEVVLAHLPGRDWRCADPMPASIQEMAPSIAQAVAAAVRLPWVLFGHCMGALVAFETVPALERQGLRAAGLIVSGRRVPTCPPRFPPVSHLPDDAFVRQMQRRCAGIPDLLLQDEEMRAWFLPTLRADIVLVDRHTPSPRRPLMCTVTAYGGTTDPQTTPDELQAWALETAVNHRLRWFARGHFFTDTARTEVLTAIAQDTAALSGRSASPDARR